MGSKELHTAEHIFARSLQNLGVDLHVKKVDTESGNVGSAFFKEKVSIDKLLAAEREVNLVIPKSLQVEEYIFNSIDEAKAKFPTLRFNEERLQGKESMRLVKIGEYDYAMCSRAHAENTSQIRAFALCGVSYPGGDTKVEFLVGEDAIDYLNVINNSVLKLSTSYNFTPDKIEEKYLSILSKNKDLEKDLATFFTSMLNSGQRVFLIKNFEIGMLLDYAKEHIKRNAGDFIALINESRVLCLSGANNRLDLSELSSILKSAGFEGGIKEHSLSGKILDPDAANKIIADFLKNNVSKSA